MALQDSLSNPQLIACLVADDWVLYVSDAKFAMRKLYRRPGDVFQEILIGCDLQAVLDAMGNHRDLAENDSSGFYGWRSAGLPVPEDNGRYIKYAV